MSGLPPHDVSNGRPPRLSVANPSVAAGVTPSGHEEPPWPMFEYHARPMPPLLAPGNLSQPQQFGRPPVYPSRPSPHPAHPNLSAMNRPQPPYPYPDGYRMYRPPNHFEAQGLVSAPHEAPGPFRLSHPQYPLPHFAQPHFTYHSSYEDSFGAPPFVPPVHTRLVPDPTAFGGRAWASGSAEAAAHGFGPSQFTASRTLREQPNSPGQRSNTGLSNSLFGPLNDNAARAATQSPQRQGQSSRPSPSSISTVPTPHRGWELGEAPDAGPPGLMGFPIEDHRPDSEFRERFMQRQRELARIRNSSLDISPQSDTSDNDALRVRRRQRLFASSRHYEPPAVTEAQIAKFKGGLKKMVLGDLPDGDSINCDICAKDYSAEVIAPCEDAEVAVELPCKHVFGEDCLDTWFSTCKTQKHKLTCPKCRKILVEPLARRPRSMQWSQLWADSPEASDLLRNLDDELRNVLSPQAFERFRAALTARGDAPVGRPDIGLILREAIVANEGHPGTHRAT